MHAGASQLKILSSSVSVFEAEIIYLILCDLILHQYRPNTSY